MAEPKYLTVSLTTKEIDNIFARISIDPKTECWDWLGAHSQQGYGRIWYHRHFELAHRLIYAWLISPIPQGFETRNLAQIDHLCKNKSCCNPAHLELVSSKTNILRSDGITAKNARKNCCKYGHPFSEKRYGKNKHRLCLVCSLRRAKQQPHEIKKKRSREFYQRHREEEKERARQYRRSHLKEKAEYQREYRRRQKEKLANQHQNLPHSRPSFATSTLLAQFSS